MIKAAGIVFVMLGSIGAGYLRKREIEEKPRQLKKLRWEIEAVGAKIRSCELSLEECFAESEIFAAAAEEIGRGVPAEKAVLDCGAQGSGLELFAHGLGAETVDGQLRNIDVFLKSLDADIAAAEEEMKKAVELWPKLCVLLGAALCILLV